MFNLWLYCRSGLKIDMCKIRTSFSDVAKLAGHAVSNEQEEQDRDLGLRVILQSIKIRLYQFPFRVHNIKSGLVITIALFPVTV